jgi:hypothetical protein
MGLRSWIAEGLATKAAISAFRNNPVVQAAVIHSSTVFDSLPLKNHLTEDTKSHLANTLFQRIQAICLSPDQIAACRTEFCGSVIEVVNYQVLVLPPPPEADPTGLRGQPGITGELKAHLVEVAQKNKEVRELMYPVSEHPTHNEVWDMVLLLYWRSHWFAETFNAARIALQDSNPDKARDWYKPFLHAMCASQENRYRKEIGLPRVLRDDLASIAYSTMMNFVLGGDRYPDLS